MLGGDVSCDGNGFRVAWPFLTGMVMSVLSTHPPSAERQAAIDAATTGTAPAMPDADWQALKRICAETGPTVPPPAG